jgi:hypothetical protein
VISLSAKIITYDLRSPGQDYTSLINAIEKYPNCVKISESCWLINNSQTTAQVRDALTPLMDSNDRIFVAALSGEAAWRNTLSSHDSIKRTLNA